MAPKTSQRIDSGATGQHKSVRAAEKTNPTLTNSVCSSLNASARLSFPSMSAARRGAPSRAGLPQFCHRDVLRRYLREQFPVLHVQLRVAARDADVEPERRDRERAQGNRQTTHVRDVDALRAAPGTPPVAHRPTPLRWKCRRPYSTRGGGVRQLSPPRYPSVPMRRETPSDPPKI